MIALRASAVRRLRASAALAVEALLARQEGLPYAHVAWLALFGLALAPWRAAASGGGLAATAVLFVTLAPIALFDARYFIVPDRFCAALAGLGALRAALLGPAALLDAGIAACLAYGALRAICALYERARGEPGLGRGDAKLFGAGALWVGLAGLPWCLPIACLSALASALIMARRGERIGARTAIPFGPHLALSIWLAWLALR